MAELQRKPGPTLLATLASALVGSALFVLLLFYWPRPIVDWMRIIVPGSIYQQSTEFAARVAAIFVAATFFLALAVFGARWVLRRLRVSNPAIGIAVIFAFVFIISFGLEATSQLVRAWGNLIASDAAGSIIEDGRLTSHGWETIARRAAVATLYTGLMAATYFVVCSIQRSSNSRV